MSYYDSSAAPYQAISSTYFFNEDYDTLDSARRAAQDYYVWLNTHPTAHITVKTANINENGSYIISPNLSDSDILSSTSGTFLVTDPETGKLVKTEDLQEKVEASKNYKIAGCNKILETRTTITNSGDPTLQLEDRIAIYDEYFIHEVDSI